MLQLQLLRVDLGGLVDGYTTAGQFIQMRVGDKKAGFFAIASPPDKENRGPVEVLVKDNAPETTAHDLCRIEPGTLEPPARLARSCLQAILGCARWVGKGCIRILHASQVDEQSSQGLSFGLCSCSACSLKWVVAPIAATAARHMTHSLGCAHPGG